MEWKQPIVYEKIIDYLNIKKNIYGYDWFKGLKIFQNMIKRLTKKYIGNKKIQNVLNFSVLKKFI